MPSLLLFVILLSVAILLFTSAHVLAMIEIMRRTKIAGASARLKLAPAVTLIWLLLRGVSAAVAQAPFPPAGLVNAVTQQAALTVIGANQAELSSHLLLDVPEITTPGPLEVMGKSLLPGTSSLVLLRTTRSQPLPPAPREKPFVAGKRLAPGQSAVIETELDAASTLNLILLAQSRGKWFYVSREVKVGRGIR